tara:strand:- start:1349 stop:3181 length:1833 start_codon:yes stop_codon:yes gene_type:complete
MANNYTVSTFTAVETLNDSIANANMITFADMEISPNQGFVIQASDFSHGTLPSSIASITFTDNAVANSFSNTVKARATFASDFVLSIANGVSNNQLDIQVDIDGTATPITAESILEDDIVVDIVNPADYTESIWGSIITSISQDGWPPSIVNLNANALPIFTPEAGFTTQSVGYENSVVVTTISGSLTKNTAKKIGTLNIEAESGYYFLKRPYLEYTNMPKESLVLAQKSITRDSNNFITAYNFDVIAKTINGPIRSASGSRVNLIYNTAPLKVVNRKRIHSVIFGDSTISSNGDNRLIKILADQDSEFDLTITDDRDNTSIIKTDLVNTTVLDPIVGQVDAISVKVKPNVGRSSQFKINQKFPKHTNVLTTAVNMAGNLNGTKAIFDSLLGVRVGDQLIMSEITGGTIVTVTELNPDGDNVNECNLSSSVTANDDAAVSFKRNEKYFINIFPKNGTTLSPNISSETPTFTLTQPTNPILTIKATTSNGLLTAPSNITYTGRPNKNASDLKNVSTVAEYFSIDYTITNSAGRAVSQHGTALPTWSSTDSTKSSWTNSVSDDNGGTLIRIYNIRTTYGTPSGTLKANVEVIKFGVNDTTMILNLDEFFTAT